MGARVGIHGDQIGGGGVHEARVGGRGMEGQSGVLGCGWARVRGGVHGGQSGGKGWGVQGTRV